MDGLIAYALSKKYADEVGQSIVNAGFKTQVEQDRSILQTTGQEKILYFIPKTTAKPSDGYDEYVYSNNAWEQVGATDVDLSSYATKAEVGNLNNLPTTDKSSIVSAISETFTSVSNGKSLVASAITDKGVSTSSDATFETMAQNIEAIQTSSDFDMTVTDNQFKMVIEVNDYDLSFWTRFGVNHGRAEISWGDGTSDVLQNDDLYLEDTPTKKHTYQSSGRYLITVSAIDENTTLVTGSINEISVLSEGEMNGNRNSNETIRILYNYKIKELSFGKKIDVDRGLNNIRCAEKIYGISSSLGNTSSCFISIRNDTAIIGNSWFKKTLIPYIKIPASVQIIENEAFTNCITKIIDFTEAQVKENGELSIVFNSKNIFQYISVNTILLFATQEIAEVAKTTTNLSQLASQIKYVGEV